MNKKTDSIILEEIFIADTSDIYEKQLIQQSFDAVELFVSVIDLKGNIILISISPAGQVRIFRPFAQADTWISGKSGGTGRGLTICRNLVEIPNGTDLSVSVL